MSTYTHTEEVLLQKYGSWMGAQAKYREHLDVCSGSPCEVCRIFRADLDAIESMNLRFPVNEPPKQRVQ